MKKFFVVLFLLVSSTLFGADAIGSMSITPKVEFAYGLGDAHKFYNPGIGAGADFGYVAVDKLTVEGGLNFMYWIGDEEGGLEYSMWMLPITVGVKYDLSDKTGLDFSVLGGLGLTYTSMEFDFSGEEAWGLGSYSSDDTDFSMYFGAEFAFSKIVVRPKFNLIFWGGDSSKSFWIDLGYRIGL